MGGYVNFKTEHGVETRIWGESFPLWWENQCSVQVPRPTEVQPGQSLAMNIVGAVVNTDVKFTVYGLEVLAVFSVLCIHHHYGIPEGMYIFNECPKRFQCPRSLWGPLQERVAEALIGMDPGVLGSEAVPC